jgi:hypothetical protein
VQDEPEGEKCLNRKRFLASNDPRKALNCLYLEATPFILGDSTDIEKYQAKKLSMLVS